MKKGLFIAITFALSLATMLPGSAGAVGPGYLCGGLNGNTCNFGLFCDLPADHCGQGFVLRGVCRVKPRACPRIYRPVCGCNYQTYNSDCQRLAAGVQLMRQGRCLFQ
ncbi:MULTISPECIES: hypothetical protein [unclassified Bradyrhizobium]|uniref:hypothetical protein n=1 Tax=unclassified Bradyrhizobium TaxID=2631580 RepID=UPI002915CB2E|nr:MULTISPECIES: hypothetical protein [unclassified Bradyrhizobium]